MIPKPTPALFLSLLVIFALLTGCGGPAVDPPAPLDASNVNLIFVVSEDLAYQDSGDINPQTTNLTNRGLQRSLLLASFLKQNVLGGANATSIHVLQPMSHLQTANQYPDMVGFATVQQFAMLNQITLSTAVNPPYTAYSYPINVSYASGQTIENVAPPFIACSNCQGLDFADQNGDNEELVKGILDAKVPGFYVFSAPWETTSALLANISRIKGYDLKLPTSYAGPNYIYTLTISSAGTAQLRTYNSDINPPSSYPTLPRKLVHSPCQAKSFHIEITGGQGGAVIPAGINTNETVHFIRHAEAHPVQYFEDGNYVAAGQWRSLTLPDALRGKIHPDIVYSIDPAQATPGATSVGGDSLWSYVRTDMTAEPYAIANNLPYGLAASFAMLAQNPPEPATQASDFFFNGGTFSNRTLLVAWEHDHIPPTVTALLNSYHGGKTAPNWPDDDYDTVWTVKLDSHGNISVDNRICEGIDSAALPATPPQF